MKQSIKTQKGFSLIMVLIVLASMIFIAIGMTSSTQMTTLLSGNYAFKEASQHAAESGYNEAWKTMKDTGSPFDDQTAQTWYYPSYTNAAGLANIKNIKTLIPSGNSGTKQVTTPVNGNGEYKVFYRVDRLCETNPDLEDIDSIRKNCVTSTYVSGSDEMFVIAFVISVKVKNNDTESYYQWVVYK